MKIEPLELNFTPFLLQITLPNEFRSNRWIGNFSLIQCNTLVQYKCACFSRKFIFTCKFFHVDLCSVATIDSWTGSHIVEQTTSTFLPTNATHKESIGWFAAALRLWDFGMRTNRVAGWRATNSSGYCWGSLRSELKHLIRSRIEREWRIIWEFIGILFSFFVIIRTEKWMEWNQ